MSLPGPIHSYAYTEYVLLEEHSPVRHEFIAGEIYAMAGGTPEHAALAASVLRLLGNQLPSGCRAYTSDLRVRVATADVTTYPDGAIICGKVVRAADDPLAATNPIVVIEVTSPSTETYDKGAKLDIYKTLPSLKEIVIVSHREPHISVHRRKPDGTWETLEAREPAAPLEVQSIGAQLTLGDVYRDFEPA